MTVSHGLGHWRHKKGGWRGTNMIGYCWWGRDTRGLAIGWCHEAPLRLRLGSRLSQMMADDWVLPLVPFRLSVIILNKAMPWAWMVTRVVEIGNTHSVHSKLRVQLVTLPDQHLTRPCLAECVLGITLGSLVSRVNLLVQVQCAVAFKTYSVELLSSETLVCVLVSSHLWWLIDYVSSWGTTRIDTCILLGNGSVHSFCHFKTESKEVLIWCMWYLSERKIHVHFIYLTKCWQ